MSFRFVILSLSLGPLSLRSLSLSDSLLSLLESELPLDSVLCTLLFIVLSKSMLTLTVPEIES